MEYGKILAYMERNPEKSRGSIARTFGIGKSTVQRAVEWSRRDRMSNPVEDTDGALEIVTDASNSVDEAIAAAGLSKSDFRIKSQLINRWTSEGGSVRTQIKVELVPKKGKESDYTNEIVEAMRKHAPVYSEKFPSVIERECREKVALEISLFDHHFGALCLQGNSGNEYNLQKAGELYRMAVESLVDRAALYDIEKIIFPIGNDFFHVNNASNTTYKGTPQDTDGTIGRIFTEGVKAVVDAIDYCSQFAPVEVLYVPGNHDPQTSFFLANVLSAWYRNCESVNVDTGGSPRKYYRYGTSLIGFTHGDEENLNSLPLIMATERPQDWAETTNKEWHIGHNHRRRQMSHQSGDAYGPVNIRTLPSLSGTDAWHHKRGYVGGNKAAEAYLWGRESGYLGHLSFSAPVK